MGRRGKFPFLSIIVYYFIFKNHGHVLIEKFLFKVNLKGILVPGREEAPSGKKEIVYQHPHCNDLIKVLGPLGSLSMTSRVKPRQPSNLHYGLAVKAHSDHFPLKSPKVKVPPGARRMASGRLGRGGGGSQTPAHREGM